jgi:hypothetical protein
MAFSLRNRASCGIPPNSAIARCGGGGGGESGGLVEHDGAKRTRMLSTFPKTGAEQRQAFSLLLHREQAKTSKRAICVMSSVYTISGSGDTVRMTRIRCKDEDKELQSLRSQNPDLSGTGGKSTVLNIPTSGPFSEGSRARILGPWSMRLGAIATPFAPFGSAGCGAVATPALSVVRMRFLSSRADVRRIEALPAPEVPSRRDSNVDQPNGIRPCIVHAPRAQRRSRRWTCAGDVQGNGRDQRFDA